MKTPALIVLVLPGGTDESQRPFSPLEPAALRMYPFTWALQARFRRSVLVRQVRYRVVGWNGDERSPMPDAQAALDDAAAAHPGVPVVALGHSMGGRVAAHLASDPRVVAVVGLAPWWPSNDWRNINADASVLALHGSADRTTSAAETRQGIETLTRDGHDATYVEIPDGGHPMLDHIRTWQRVPIAFVARILRSHTGSRQG